MILAFLLFWLPPPDAAVSIVHVFEVRCEVDAQGQLVMVPDGFGGLRPDCHARKDTETTAAQHEVPEPRPYEIYGWPGYMEAQGPCVSVKDLSGNESEEACAP